MSNEQDPGPLKGNRGTSRNRSEAQPARHSLEVGLEKVKKKQVRRLPARHWAGRNSSGVKIIKNFTDTVSIAVVNGVAFVNRGSDIDGNDVGRVVRNLIANATGKVKIACHTAAAGEGLGNRFTAAELVELLKTYQPCLRSGWTTFKKKPGGMTTPYLSLVATEKTPVPVSKATPNKKGAAKVVD